MIIEIPGYKTLNLQYLVLDYNGTIAIDGTMPDTIKLRLRTLAESLEIYILTADTHGTAEENCRGLPLHIHTFPSSYTMEEKLKVIESLGAEHCATIGNGRNDTKMLQAGALAIAVMDQEGMYGKLASDADICVHAMEDALDLLCHPKRLIATLRG